ncbi:MAG: hypothetical protein KAH01_07770, partial [Caldisericia bacterium]|nr:hypothetical protein [Caldisericia bacterium]
LFPWVKIRKDRSKIDSWQIYTGTQRSRMEDNCAEILIGTRWSTGDVHAKLLDLEPEEWEKIIIPALDKNGRYEGSGGKKVGHYFYMIMY